MLVAEMKSNAITALQCGRRPKGPPAWQCHSLVRVRVRVRVRARARARVRVSVSVSVSVRARARARARARVRAETPPGRSVVTADWLA